MRKDKKEIFEKRKQDLLGSTLLKLPLTPFEVEDLSCSKTGTLSNDEQFRRLVFVILYCYY